MSRSVNIGVMSIRPSKGVFDKILAELHSFDGREDKPDDQDQGWLEMFLRAWGAFGGVYEEGCVPRPEYANLGLEGREDGIAWCFHPIEYNVYVSASNASFLKKALKRGSPKLLHWPSRGKPWCMKNTYRSVFDQLWWQSARPSLGLLKLRLATVYASCQDLTQLRTQSPNEWQSMLERRRQLDQVVDCQRHAQEAQGLLQNYSLLHPSHWLPPVLSAWIDNMPCGLDLEMETPLFPQVVHSPTPSSLAMTD